MPTQTVNAAPTRERYTAGACPPNWQGSAPATSDHDAPIQAQRPGVG